jgi:hypothetical protein
LPDDHSAPPVWRKSSKSEFGCCVEVAFGAGTVRLRNSRHPDGPVLEFPAAVWDAFVADVREHCYDLPRERTRVNAVLVHGRARDRGDRRPTEEVD